MDIGRYRQPLRADKGDCNRLTDIAVDGGLVNCEPEIWVTPSAARVRRRDLVRRPHALEGSLSTIERMPSPSPDSNS
ncbi:hypothetical protein ACQI4L_21540 [Mycolicibacterium litorale]|uniref:hypothetical protein n=1 Tax=Mycolicibacterium litorale TaxID=758802 RepID=UPI003CF27958